MTTVLQCTHYFCSEGSKKLSIYPNVHVQGLTGSSDTSQLRTDYILTRHAMGGERYVLYIVGPGTWVVPYKSLCNMHFWSIVQCCGAQICAVCGGGCEWDVWCWSGGNDQPSRPRQTLLPLPLWDCCLWPGGLRPYHGPHHPPWHDKGTRVASICITNNYFQSFCLLVISKRINCNLWRVRGLDSFSFFFSQSSMWIYLFLQHLPRESPRAYEALYTANEIVTICDPFDKSTFQRWGWLQPYPLVMTTSQLV